jgi:DNA adenine methylase
MASASETTRAAAEVVARPFLKWAGGKRQLLPTLRTFYPSSFASYLEPFAGSAAVFFDLYSSRLLTGRPATLIDSNADLMGCLSALRNDVDAVLDELRRLEEGHRRGRDRFYYIVRDGRFNQARRPFSVRPGNGARRYSPELAAMFIYLNRTGFNGLFRLNAAGEFNVPVGRYVNPRICDEANLRAVSDALNRPNATLRVGTYRDVGDLARPGDFLYFDPPYAPLTPTSSFTSYTADRFGDDDQRALQRLVIELASRGCHVLLSNSTAPLIRELYDGNPEARRAGLRAMTVSARRAINSNAARRGAVLEYLITNIAHSAHV